MTLPITVGVTADAAACVFMVSSVATGVAVYAASCAAVIPAVTIEMTGNAACIRSVVMSITVKVPSDSTGCFCVRASRRGSAVVVSRDITGSRVMIIGFIGVITTVVA